MRVGRPVAICVAQLVADGHAEVGELEEQPDRLIGCLGDYEWPDPQPTALHVGFYRYPLESLPLPAEGCDDIRERYAVLGEEAGFCFEQEDADAARLRLPARVQARPLLGSVQLHHRPGLHRWRSGKRSRLMAPRSSCAVTRV